MEHDGSSVYLLDVGPEQFADALFCQFGTRRVLIDGAHPGDHVGRDGHLSIPEQLAQIIGGAPPHHVDLLVVSHAHQDHIGCLPQLVADRFLTADWALVADPDLGWGHLGGSDDAGDTLDARAGQLVAALRDECAPLEPGLSDAALLQFMQDAADLEQRYRDMLETLRAQGTRVVRLGQDSVQSLENAFQDLALHIVGPSQDQLIECAQLIKHLSALVTSWVNIELARHPALTATDLYRRVVERSLDIFADSRLGPAVNLQSAVLTLQFRGHRFLFAGDMQFSNTQVSSPTLKRSVMALRQSIAAGAPYSLAKLSHHGSKNAFSEEILAELRNTTLFGICTGADSKKHPNPKILDLLDTHRADIRWARTDRNRLVTMSFRSATPSVTVERGSINDPRPNT